jgi:hypothetical protein
MFCSVIEDCALNTTSHPDGMTGAKRRTDSRIKRFARLR